MSLILWVVLSCLWLKSLVVVLKVAALFEFLENFEVSGLDSCGVEG